jgi:undecaprenyl-diphosphatase
MIQQWNEQWLIFLNSLTDTQQLQTIFWIIADLPIFFLPIFLISMWVYYVIKNNNEQKKWLLLLFYSTILALTINLIIQNLVHFDRPESVLQWVWNLILDHIPDASFPSDHTAVSIAFATALFFTGYRKIAYIFFPIACLMNISRIISWVHWPFDVIVGTFIGILSGYIICVVLKENKYITLLSDNLLKLSKIFKL